MNMRWMRRIYVELGTKTSLESYRAHEGYNFDRTIQYLILHEKRYKKQVEEAKIFEELKKKNQSRLDTFGREIPTKSESAQASAKEEDKAQ